LLGGNLDTDLAEFTNLDVRKVPEPAGIVGLAVGLLGLAAQRRRFKR
jgi:hypothetical protein